MQYFYVRFCVITIFIILFFENCFVSSFYIYVCRTHVIKFTKHPYNILCIWFYTIFFEFDSIYVFGSVKPQNLCLIFWFCATWVFIFII